MEKSVWPIAVMGVAGLLALVLLAMVAGASLQKEMHEEAPYWIGMVDEVQKHFGFESARIGVQERGGVTTLHIAYETDKYLRFSPENMRKEMNEVAQYLADRRRDGSLVTAIQVTRTEVRRIGCSQDSHVADVTIHVPRKNPGRPIMRRTTR